MLSQIHEFVNWVRRRSPEARTWKDYGYDLHFFVQVVGDRAPDFTLPAQTGAQVSLAGFQGQKAVVLFFYPKDGTAVCTREACSFRDAYEDFLQAGIYRLPAQLPESPSEAHIHGLEAGHQPVEFRVDPCLYAEH